MKVGSYYYLLVQTFANDLGKYEKVGHYMSIQQEVSSILKGIYTYMVILKRSCYLVHLDKNERRNVQQQGFFES